MRTAVWLESDGNRVRGSYNAVPYTAEIEGRVAPSNDVFVHIEERGATQAIPSRTRVATLHWASDGSQLTGTDDLHTPITLLRAGFDPPGLRPGLWLSHWTGLPYGLAVETRIASAGPNAYRAVYQYQGTGGVRDGSFEGHVNDGAALEIVWTEWVSAQTVARGRGVLRPSEFGLRGSFGIDGNASGTGEWSLEPVTP
jgi:hypothetical protein